MSVALTFYNYRVATAVLQGKATVPDIAWATGLTIEAVRDQVAALRVRGVLCTAGRRPRKQGGSGGTLAVYALCPGVRFDSHPGQSKVWAAVALVPVVPHE